jgi:hypothetical protein
MNFAESDFILVLFVFRRQLINEKEKIRREFYLKVAESQGRAKGIENALNGNSFQFV